MIPMFENFHPGIIFILVGFFAALCAKKGCRPADLDGAEVRRTLAAAGARR